MSFENQHEAIPILAVLAFYPYWQYTDLFIVRFVSLLCLRSTLRLLYPGGRPSSYNPVRSGLTWSSVVKSNAIIASTIQKRIGTKFPIKCRVKYFLKNSKTIYYVIIMVLDRGGGGGKVRMFEVGPLI